MRGIHRLRSAIRALLSREVLERDMDEEMRFHVERETEELVRTRGLSPQEARRQALISFGGVGRYKEAARDVRGLPLDHLRRDIRLAFRQLRRSPLSSAAILLSLALGIGANAGIFSVFEQVLLRPLPVREPQQLVNMAASTPNPGWKACTVAGGCEVVFSYPTFRDLEQGQTGFAGIAAHRGFAANLAYRGRTLHGEGMLVSGSYFDLLGLRPALGRLLVPADDETIGGQPVAILSHSYWETQLGADPDVLEQTITINGQPMTIVGVAPRGFEGTTLGIRPRVFATLSMAGAILPEFAGSFDERRHYWLYLFGRLEPGGSIDQAGAAINALYRSIINKVEVPLQAGMSEQNMALFRRKEIAFEPGARGQSALQRETRGQLIALLAITAVVLFISCANIANLLLARGAQRRTEMAIRLSLGAARHRIWRQLLTESCVLAVLGGVASLFIARWILSGVASILPPESIATLDFGLRWPIAIFAAGLTVGTGLLFGMFPAFDGARPDPGTTIRAKARLGAGGRSAARLRSSLVAAQIALSVVLLISAGLFLKSLRNIGNVDLGLRAPDQVVTFRISPGLNGYEPAHRRSVFDRLERELAALPGVVDVSGSVVPALSGVSAGTAVSVEGFQNGPATDDNARVNHVGADFFRTLGIPLQAGREFTPADAEAAPRVAIVNETFARKFGLGSDVVGKRMARGYSETLDIEIVGLVRDAKYFDVKDEVPALFVTPYRQDEPVDAITYYLRVDGDPRRLLRDLPGLVAGLDPDLPVEELKTLPQQMRETVFLDRMIGSLSAAFAVLATLLAAIGLYGVTAYTVAQRTPEIGLRIALGADSRRIRGTVFRQVGLTVVVGGAVGVAVALALGRSLESLLFGLQGNDPVVVSLAVAFLGLVALAASYLPARRAERVDPMIALRRE